MAYVSLCDNARDVNYNAYNEKVKDNMKSLLDILLKYSDKPIDISEIKNALLNFNSQIKTKKIKKDRTRKNRS
jgi:hypothetical protein